MAFLTYEPALVLPAFPRGCGSVILCCYRLWKRRNEVVFNGVEQPLLQVLAGCKEDARLWVCRFRRKERGLADDWCATFSRTQ
ncbi:hypothetical protein BS78_05G066900 [Paspalum vaginatum]|nr:hypothetical protein BS78_05G066900 [Paspalum vaginatum]